jgi:3-oxoacyl-[acyl-carrier protein] reductase
LVLITGGSRGVGHAIAMACAREGANIAFTYLKAEEESLQTEKALRDLGSKVWRFKVNATDKPATWAMVAKLEAESDGVDALVNNAGIGQVVPLALMEEEDWDRMMSTNVKGAFIASQAVMRGMIKRERGRILNISSLAGVKMMHAPVHYCAAKAALKGFTEGLAKELGRYRITVNCLAPGILDAGVSVNIPAAKKEEYLRHCALRRLGTCDEAAEVAAFLLSDRNSYMTGSTVVLDGGL